MTTPKKVLTLDNINPRVRDIKVSFQGSLGIRASEIEREIHQGVGRPFGEMTACHIGDLHATGQKPCTFLRQVVALCTYPALLDSSSFPDDAKRRARAAMKELENGSVGSYNGGYIFRTMPQKISRFIERRDGGVPCTPQNITLSCGTAMAIGCVLSFLVSKEEPLRTGILISVPQCPVYAGAIVMAGAVKVEYSLDEECRWALNVHSIRESLYAAREHCNPKVLCITNPGNPTGQVLSRECIEDVIRLAAEENLLLLADEVYQDNVFAPGCTFHSFKKVLFEMGPQFSERVQLVSVYSISKGVIGECGLRSGYIEFVNIEPAVVRRVYLMASYTTAPVMGALALDIITDPPQPGEPSYDAFIEEKQDVLRNLAEKARLTEEILNQAPGIHCNPVQGAMYSFPRIQIPEKAIKLAEAQGLEPDLFFCHRLLEKTGIIVAPGSAFGQAKGTYHIRITLQPATEKLESMLQSLTQFHAEFMQEYS